MLNVCRSYLRDIKTAPLSLEAMSGGLRFDALPFAGGDPGPQEVAEAQELHRTVREAAGALSPRNRAATLLFYYDQLSVREVAANLGLSVPAVKTRLHRSRAEPREELLRRYPEIEQRQEARKMIKVTIADLMSQEPKNPITGDGCPSSWSRCWTPSWKKCGSRRSKRIPSMPWPSSAWETNQRDRLPAQRRVRPRGAHRRPNLRS